MLPSESSVMGGLPGTGQHIAGAWSWGRQEPGSSRFIAEQLYINIRNIMSESGRTPVEGGLPGRVWRKGSPHILLMGTKIGTATMQSSMEDPQEIEDRTPVRASNTTPGHVSRVSESRILKPYLYSHTHGSVIHSHQNTKTTQVSVDRWMDRADLGNEYNGMWLSHARKEILPSATVWMDFKDIMLSDMGQRSTRTTCCHLYVGPVKGWTVAARSWGLEDQRPCWSNGTSSQLWEDEILGFNVQQCAVLASPWESKS